MAEVETVFIKLPGIEGSTKVKGLEGFIPFNSVSFIISSEAKSDNNGVLSVGGAHLTPFRAVKYDDYKTDDSMVMKMLSGESFPEVIIVKATTNKGKLVENRRITLNNVCIISAETILVNDDRAISTFYFVSSKFKRESYSVGKDGSAVKVGPMAYDFTTAEAQ
uniref:Type VI secretion system tube protein Hcp n=1 Tax=Yersinia enterocolitica TaxID=630 RepID=F2Q842_YEREN|nr:hypothetical protein Y69_0044 [Yersinia enterocolitica]